MPGVKPARRGLLEAVHLYLDFVGHRFSASFDYLWDCLWVGSSSKLFNYPQVENLMCGKCNVMLSPLELLSEPGGQPSIAFKYQSSTDHGRIRAKATIHYENVGFSVTLKG